MPLILPPFSQFQGAIVPLKGNWNRRPPEGDMYVNAEIDWGSQANDAVQFAFSGNSPVALSQIVALYVDNRRCGVDCDFVFPDSGFRLTVLAHAQGLFPVLTNALMYYAVALGAGGGDTTIIQTLNTLPPPIALIPPQIGGSEAIGGISASASGTSPIIPATVSGTLNSLQLSLDFTAGAGVGSLAISLVDGASNTLWLNNYSALAGVHMSFPVLVADMGVRFVNGVSLGVVSSGMAGGGTINVNVFFSTP